ncbi:MAG: PQQ-dependent sugar dehydrogenase [Planctomycetaceae bacterium]
MKWVTDVCFRAVAVVCVLCVCGGEVCGQSAERQRVTWVNSRLRGTAEPPLPFRAVRAYPQLKLFKPVFVRAEPGSDRLVFVDHAGDWADPGGLRVCRDVADVAESVPLLALDRMIYGFCFHPKYAENGFIYLLTNGPVKAENKQNRISRFTMQRDGQRLLAADSELVILEWDSNGHNGGDLAFGPDGYLYCPTGDGTSDSDPLQTGQGVNDLLAVMLRLDVDRPTADRPYSIPPDNPYVDVAGARPEIWAYGFRNPWRMAYDWQSNQLWVGQNGQDLWEQVYLVRRGENYGWSVQEGSQPFYPLRSRGKEPIVNPAAEHHHSEFRSLTGGVVYRGSGLAGLDGSFVYGDYSTGRIWSIRHDGRQVTENREIADTTLQITGFAQNHAGELLVVDHGGGIYRLEASPAEEPVEFPQRLSDTGLFANVSEHRMAAGVLSYSVNAQLWSDGAWKQRWLAVPDQEQIEYTSSRGWTFPNGSVLVKSFALEREAGRADSRHWIETRIMVRHQNEWAGYSYRWNEQQTDAELVGRGGEDEQYVIRDAAASGGERVQSWHYPSRAECMVCHSRAANYVLGLCELQMNRSHDYGEYSGNQLQVLGELGFFRNPPAQAPEQLGKLVDPLDESQETALRVRSYLHANCAGCHVEAGGGNSQFSAEFTAKSEQQKLIGVKPVHNAFGLPDAALIQPGRPESSVLLHRVSQRGVGQMPPLASSVRDERAIELLRRWIEGL